MPFFDIYLKKFVVEADSAIEAREAASQRWNVQTETMAALLQIHNQDTQEALDLAAVICKDAARIRENWQHMKEQQNHEAAQYLLDAYMFMSHAYKAVNRYAGNLDTQAHEAKTIDMEMQTTRAMGAIESAKD